MAICGIYQIKNQINNKIYIGQSIDVERRLRQHLGYCRNHDFNNENEHLLNSFIKYGEKNFKASIITTCQPNQLNLFEEWFINILGSANPKNGYNKTLGGESNIPTEEMRKKMSSTRSGRRNPMYGKTQTKQTRETISRRKNKTGFLNVGHAKDNRLKQGFSWRYRYTNQHKQRQQILKTNLYDLKQEVLKRNLEWKIIDKNNAKQTCDRYNYTLNKLK